MAPVIQVTRDEPGGGPEFLPPSIFGLTASQRVFTVMPQLRVKWYKHFCLMLLIFCTK